MLVEERWVLPQEFVAKFSRDLGCKLWAQLGKEWGSFSRRSREPGYERRREDWSTSTKTMKYHFPNFPSSLQVWQSWGENGQCDHCFGDMVAQEGTDCGNKVKLVDCIWVLTFLGEIWASPCVRSFSLELLYYAHWDRGHLAVILPRHNELKNGHDGDQLNRGIIAGTPPLLTWLQEFILGQKDISLNATFWAKAKKHSTSIHKHGRQRKCGWKLISPLQNS